MLPAMDSQQRRTLVIAVAIVGGLFLSICGLVGVVALIHRYPSGPASLASPSGITDAGNGSAIINDFLSNPIDGERKWVGKRVRVFGVVTIIDRNDDGFYVGLMGNLYLFPDADQLDEFAKVRTGQVIEAEATVSGYVEHWDQNVGRQVHLRAARFIGFRKR